jgi:hypothetical protein
LKGIQLSCVLTEMASLIVSFGAGSLKFEIIIANRKRTPKFPACGTLQDWILTVAASARMTNSCTIPVVQA